MELVGLSFQNYKAFPGRESIEIRPLTVLIGRNSSGKSSVARLPILLSGALSGRAQSPLPLECEGVDFGGSFVELIHNQKPHGAIELGAVFEDGGERFELAAKVQHYQESRLAVVQELSVTIPGKGRSIFEYVDDDPVRSPHHYRVTTDGHPSINMALGFNGLRPELAPAFVRPETRGLLDVVVAVAAVLGDMDRALSAIGYLGPFRANPQRYYRDPGGVPSNVGQSGVLAPALLGSDALRKGGNVVRAVSEWYKKYLGGWQLDVVWSGNMFSIVVRNPEAPDLAVNIVDVGAGISQVLPLIVQRKFEEVTGKHGGLEIVEQPELHLHPAAHGDLADLYIAAAQHPGARFLIETHSENLILRIRRRVAEGTLDPALLHLYWVDDEQAIGSRVQLIDVARTGDVSAWPKGVFSEDYEEAKAIRKAQRSLEGSR